MNIRETVRHSVTRTKKAKFAHSRGVEQQAAVGHEVERAPRGDVPAFAVVLADGAGCQRALDRDGGGGDHAHVDLDRLLAADTKELALGEHPQQAGLQLEGELADIYALIQAMQEAVVAAGARRVSTVIKIDDRRDRQRRVSDPHAGSRPGTRRPGRG